MIEGDVLGQVENPLGSGATGPDLDGPLAARITRYPGGKWSVAQTLRHLRRHMRQGVNLRFSKKLRRCLAWRLARPIFA